MTESDPKYWKDGEEQGLDRCPVCRDYIQAHAIDEDSEEYWACPTCGYQKELSEDSDAIVLDEVRIFKELKPEFPAKSYVIFKCDNSDRWIKIHAGGRVETSGLDEGETIKLFWEQVEAHCPSLFSQDAQERIASLEEQVKALDEENETYKREQNDLITQLDAKTEQLVEFSSHTEKMQAEIISLLGKLRKANEELDKKRDSIEKLKDFVSRYREIVDEL